MSNARAWILGLIATAFTAGCTSVTETYPAHESAQVWTALIAVAETPEYDAPDPADRWWVKENAVQVFDDESRIEIYRELDRMLHRPGAKPEREFRRWKLQVRFVSEPVPSATVTSRGAAFPVDAQEEIARYFADVRDLLAGGGSAIAAPAADDEPVPSAVPDAGEPMVDIEILEPDGG